MNAQRNVYNAPGICELEKEGDFRKKLVFDL